MLMIKISGEYVKDLEEEVARLRKELYEIYGALRNYELNGSDAPKQIRGIYADGDLTYQVNRELRRKLKEAVDVCADFASALDNWEQYRIAEAQNIKVAWLQRARGVVESNK